MRIGILKNLSGIAVDDTQDKTAKSVPAGKLQYLSGCLHDVRAGAGSYDCTCWFDWLASKRLAGACASCKCRLA